MSFSINNSNNNNNLPPMIWSIVCSLETCRQEENIIMVCPEKHLFLHTQTHTHTRGTSVHQDDQSTEGWRRSVCVCVCACLCVSMQTTLIPLWTQRDWVWDRWPSVHGHRPGNTMIFLESGFKILFNNSVLLKLTVKFWWFKTSKLNQTLKMNHCKTIKTKAEKTVIVCRQLLGV